MSGYSSPDVSLREWLPRTAGLLTGVLALATAFLAAHVGALHQPTPKDVPVGVVRTDQRAQEFLHAVRDTTDKIKAIGYASANDAAQGLAERGVYATIGSEPGAGLRLTIASASAPTATDLIKQVLAAAAQRAGIPLAVTDQAPVSANDEKGLVPFYLTIGLIFGGYLAPTVLGQAGGTTPPRLRIAGLRITALAAYSALLGTVGALITGPIVHIWDHDLPAVAAASALVAFTAALLAATVQSWFGPLGTGLVILLLVAFGTPSSGGAVAPEFLPGALREMNRWNIPGLATDLLRSVAYFDHRAVLGPLWALLAWIAFGLVGVLSATVVRGGGRRRRDHRPQATAT